MMMLIRLPLQDPSPIFAVALLLVLLILGLWRWLKLDSLTLTRFFVAWDWNTYGLLFISIHTDK